MIDAKSHEKVLMNAFLNAAFTADGRVDGDIVELLPFDDDEQDSDVTVKAKRESNAHEA
jgi:hypothetical protein